jgi:outer membrane lipoprotein-sorting protein
VRIYVDRETGFPHRIMYLKKLVGREVHKPMVTLDFIDVELNQPINNNDFDYQPPDGVTPVEQTKAFVDRLTPPETKAPPGAPQPAGPPVR